MSGQNGEENVYDHVFGNGRKLSMQEKNKRAILITLAEMEKKIADAQARVVEINAFLGSVVNRMEVIEAFQNKQRIAEFGSGPTVRV